MKTQTYLIFALLILLLSASCTQDKVLPENTYQCQFAFADTSNSHPKASVFQDILDENRKAGLVGAVLLVKDDDGLWMGSSGHADLASDVEMQPCNTFLIASISKVFTAASLFRYIDKGELSLEDPLTKWLPSSITEKVDNAEEAQIQHLLSHTSGIRDYYTDQFELDRMNRTNNHFTQEEVLTYTYGLNANFPVGETYRYSNTNYLLLAMILESVSGTDFATVYQQELFMPLGLSSAYYSVTDPIPAGCVKGYSDLYGTGENVAESQNLYQDELGIGGDGGIAINAYDLAVFLEALMKGQVISASSLDDMTNWFDLPTDWHWEAYGQYENGYGLEKFDTEIGYAVGHTGGIDGFSSFGFYFPESDQTYVLLVNSSVAWSGDAKEAIFNQVLSELQ